MPGWAPGPDFPQGSGLTDMCLTRVFRPQLQSGTPQYLLDMPLPVTPEQAEICTQDVRDLADTLASNQRFKCSSDQLKWPRPGHEQRDVDSVDVGIRRPCQGRANHQDRAQHSFRHGYESSFVGDGIASGVTGLGHGAPIASAASESQPAEMRRKKGARADI